MPTIAPPRNSFVGHPTLPTLTVGRVKRSVTRHVGAFYRGGLRFAPPALLLLSLLAGCAEPAPPQTQAQPEPYACFLPSEKRMLVAELFFGRNIPGRPPVSEAEWSDFVTQVIRPNLPDGYTVLDSAGGAGKLRPGAPPIGRGVREPAKIVIAAAERSPALRDHLTAIIDAYRSRFRQQSVGVITRTACASF